jgi:integrase
MTIKNYLIALKTALGWAVQQKLLPSMPAFPSIKVPKKKPQPVPTEAFERMVEFAPDDHWRAFLLCGWWAGLRLSEALHLRRSRNDKRPWLDMENDRIILPAEFAKSDVDQWVPLHPTLREALEQLPDTGDEVFPFRSRKGGELLTRNGVTNRVILIAKRAGVRLSMHKLRKGFGCRVAKQLGKGNAPILHSLMRHSSMQITMDYYATVDDALQEAISALT